MGFNSGFKGLRENGACGISTGVELLDDCSLVDGAVINVFQEHSATVFFFFCFVLWPTNAQLFHKLSHSYVSTLSYHPQGACNQYFAKLLAKYWLLWPTNAQLFHKLSHSYMFWHYRVILSEPVINTLPSYTSISNAAVGNTIYN